ncbi:hypothetical protein AAFF_G00093510 [Aldrovandia affinis]|uniref:Uncharacterized protein n=1 Tax=Aldrovandia affinis TaxID=143900 RepID=A0AAD7WY59_9TELE|nr:hypothetical protein AAFF_G00093510 [Aldrovandia affinis]
MGAFLGDVGVSLRSARRVQSSLPSAIFSSPKPLQHGEQRVAPRGAGPAVKEQGEQAQRPEQSLNMWQPLSHPAEPPQRYRDGPSGVGSAPDCIAGKGSAGITAAAVHRPRGGPRRYQGLSVEGGPGGRWGPVGLVVEGG